MMKEKVIFKERTLNESRRLLGNVGVLLDTLDGIHLHLQVSDGSGEHLEQLSDLRSGRESNDVERRVARHVDLQTNLSQQEYQDRSSLENDDGMVIQ